MTGPGVLLAGRYELLERIGAGGMATVWRARDRRLERHVAVKLLRAQFADDPEFTARFEVEARNAASLSHPHVATVFDTGLDGGRRFIVMELVDGPTVADIIRVRGPLPPGQAVDIAADAARALAAAHRRGLIHRDVKPANILVGRDGRVRLTDFGIARALTTSRVTMPGTILGSIPYLSPEQARGEEASAAGDVFSLGVVLYEMLTARLPWEADSPAALATVRMTEPPAPMTAAREDLPRSLEAIVGRALELDPGTRYPSARAFSEALEAWARRNASSLQPEPDLADTARLVAAQALPFAGAGGEDDPLLRGLPEGHAVAGAAVARVNPGAGPAAAEAPLPPVAAAPASDPRPTGRIMRARPHRPSRPAARRPGGRPARRDASERPADRDRRALLVALAALTPLVLVGMMALGTMLGDRSGGAVLEATGTPEAIAQGPTPAATPAPSPSSPPSTPSPTPSPAAEPTPAPTTDATPTPTATFPPREALQPIVGPTPTPAPTPRPTSAPATTASTSGPAAAVADFYDAVEEHDWDRAISRWSPSMQDRYPVDEWLIGRFQPTTRIDITRLSTISADGNRARVAVTLVEYRTVEPSPRTLSGAWDLVRLDGRWLLDDPDF
ncbi:MAG TPA: protein kinase [Candidatus Limnocylindrales bacterium]|nr:protein kinase [Candidatus Limnocylindrales bacterium]